MAWTAIGEHTVMDSNRQLSLKRKAFNHFVLSRLTCGAETWRLTKDLERKLKNAEKGMERKVLGIT